MDSVPFSWRLIDTGPLAGAANMAVDQALLNCFDPNCSLPVLRLYGWQPPCLSLGRFQKRDDVLDTARCEASGVAVVRRMTGGGVIYHAHELTYAIVCAPRHIPPSASIKESFRVLTAFLVGFYRKLGLAAHYAAEAASDGTRLGARTAFCFAGRESYDILVGGRKIGGNAQRRLKNVIFQHGSIPVLNCAQTGATFMSDPPASLGRSVAALDDLGIVRTTDELKALLVESFRENMPAQTVNDGLTSGEEAEVRRLLNVGRIGE